MEFILDFLDEKNLIDIIREYLDETILSINKRNLIIELEKASYTYHIECDIEYDRYININSSYIRNTTLLSVVYTMNRYNRYYNRSYYF